MAYPYLPVNPCCTDVVINDPCGCSSTYINSGCNSNNPCSTNLTASSTIVYDGPALTCTTAEPCDTLNVILQKIDEIICNLLNQVNYLTNQVTNITTQIIAINGNIINIYNTLGECCSATTTTTSTTTATPCESFSLDNTGVDPVAIIITDCITGEQEAIVLMPGETNICVETDSPLVVPGTVIVTPTGPCNTTTTTTTAAPTTTTTTTAYACECLTIYNGDSNPQVVTYTDCDGIVNEGFIIDAFETIKVCGCCALATSELVTISVGENCIDGVCPLEPTTTTTTTTIQCNCYPTEITITSQELATTDDNSIAVIYSNCYNNQFVLTYNTPGVYSIGCVNYDVGITSIGLIDGIETNVYVPITLEDTPCCNEITTTTSSTSSTTTTTTTIVDIPCKCVDIIISQADIDDSTGNSFLNGFVNVEGYPKELTCEGGDVQVHYDTAGTYSYCLKTGAIPTISLYYLKDNNVITTIESEIVNLGTPCLVDGECIPTTTTSTTTVDPFYYYVTNQYLCPNCDDPVGVNVIIKTLTPLSIGDWVLHTFDSVNFFSFNVLSVSPFDYMATLVDGSGASLACNCPATTTTTTTAEPTTTTTTTSPLAACKSYSADGTGFVYWDDCFTGIGQSYEIAGGVYNFCAIEGTPYSSGSVLISILGDCAE